MYGGFWLRAHFFSKHGKRSEVDFSLDQGDDRIGGTKAETLSGGCDGAEMPPEMQIAIAARHHPQLLKLCARKTVERG